MRTKQDLRDSLQVQGAPLSFLYGSSLPQRGFFITTGPDGQGNLYYLDPRFQLACK